MTLLRLQQLCNSSLPVGAYSYSEGLETLCEQAVIVTGEELQRWLAIELASGSICIETAVMSRAYRAWQAKELLSLVTWNDWYTANRETEEFRIQSLQMGRSLIKLMQDLEPQLNVSPLSPRSCHYCIAFGVACGYWNIDLSDAALGYVQSWVVNLVNAGVKLIPLGQTEGQRIILGLADAIAHAADKALGWQDSQLESNSWGMQLASMAHETQYTRIFRS